MSFARRVVGRVNAPYPLGVLRLGGAPCIVSSTEDRGPVLIARPPFERLDPIIAGPGGCMALVPDPELNGELYAIMGCFPGYRFQTGSIHRIHGEGNAWVSRKIADLPFAHRIDFVSKGTHRWLIAATLAEDKRDPGDWSRPGCLFACRVPEDRDDAWTLAPVLPGIHRNHGLLVASIRGRRSVLVSGAEGLFTADLDDPGPAWDFACLVNREISEVAVLDLDGDGAEELITIEPFHGNRLRVYRQDSEDWQLAWEAELDFGHGLLATRLRGLGSILVSNRAGTRDLLLFQFPRGLAEPVRSIVDAGAGVANVLVLREAGRERIFATRQVTGEVVMYEEPAGA